MSEMVSKVCEQSKMITQLTAALQAKDAKIIQQFDQLKQAKTELAKKQEEVEALHDVWWRAYNCFPQSWEDVTEHLIDDKGVIDIEAAKVLAEKLRKKPGLEEEK